jgi:hypothetical protein
MPIQRTDIVDEVFESQLLVMLESAGFAPRREKDVIHLTGVGIGRGNSSVDVEINLVSMDGHRILEVIAPLRMPPVSFELASLMCTQGNIECLIAKFKPVEKLVENTHTVQAILTLYADHLSEEELSRMLYLFIKEIERVDDELIFWPLRIKRRLGNK